MCLSIHAYVFTFTHKCIFIQYSALYITPQIFKMIIIIDIDLFSSITLYIFIHFTFDIVNIDLYKMTFDIVSIGFACSSRARDECRYFHK